MHKYANFLTTLLFSGLLVLGFNGCDDDSDKTSSYEEHEHDHEDERTIFFYNSETNTHLAYEVGHKELINLNQEMHEEHNISNFNLASTDEGVPFIWLDDKGDENASNDEEKIVMFKSSFDFDKNVTWEDFYYLGHFHYEDDGSVNLASHSNEEFDVTSGAKIKALQRLDLYIAEQNELKNTFSTKLGQDICGIYTNIDLDENETTYYVMNLSGRLYVFEDTESDASDEVQVSSSCDPDNLGMSGVEGGVWVFLADKQTIYEVDSHHDGVHHVHESFNVSEYVGDKEISKMVSIKPYK